MCVAIYLLHGLKSQVRCICRKIFKPVKQEKTGFTLANIGAHLFVGPEEIVFLLGNSKIFTALILHYFISAGIRWYQSRLSSSNFYFEFIWSDGNDLFTQIMCNANYLNDHKKYIKNDILFLKWHGACECAIYTHCKCNGLKDSAYFHRKTCSIRIVRIA